MKPDFIGIGVQKAGTSWIYSVLAQHPDIGVAYGDEKDTRFFTCYFDRGYSWYEEHFRGFGEKKVVGEYSTSYFPSLDACERIHAYHPDVKLIVCLRNPVERILSNHRHQLQLGHVVDGNALIEEALDTNPSYIDQSRYFTHLKRWFHLFPRRQILILLFDDVQSSPGNVCRQLYEFVGVSADYQPSIMHQQINPTRNVRNTRLDKWLDRASRTARNAGLSTVVDLAKATGLRKAAARLNEKKQPSENTDLESVFRGHINGLLREEVSSLANLIGRDLEHWQ